MNDEGLALIKNTRTVGGTCCICGERAVTGIGNPDVYTCLPCNRAGMQIPVPYHELGLEPWQVIERKRDESK